MISDGCMVDDSWELTIIVTDLQVEKTLRVKGDLHIGGVMLQLVEALDIALDWSDHALWWPERNMWLSRTRSTLDQYGVQADARLQFTPMHKILRLQLPDLQIINTRVDFSCNVLRAVIQICKEFGIRHPEELSLMKKLEKEDLKRNYFLTPQRRSHRLPTESPGGLSNSGSHHLSNNSLDGTLSPFANRSPMGPSPQATMIRNPGTPSSVHSLSPYNTLNANGTLSPGSLQSFDGNLESSLINSPLIAAKDAFGLLYRLKTYSEKARVNKGWLDSSRSLMEQNVKDNDFVLLRYKFFSFYDLNPKYDAVRINQIYEQAKWALMAEEIDCTEEEMMMFAALQVQIQLQISSPQPDLDLSGNHTDEDDIDAALQDLQDSLEGSSVSSPGDITHVPELGDYLRVFKPKKFTLKKFKEYWCTFKDNYISLYKNKEDGLGSPVIRINTRGCEPHPDVNLSAKKYGIKLFVASAEGMSEIWLRFEMEDQYCRWMAACRLASKGKTMADSSYEGEVSTLRTFLSMQHPAPLHASPVSSQVDIHAEDYIAPRFFKRIKSGQLVRRIMEAHSNVKDMSLIDAKMAYIKAWQALPEYGITYFIIKMQGLKKEKEELVGVANNRIIRMDLHTGDSIKTWRYNTLKSWRVNWEAKHVILDFEEEQIIFSCLTADCKVVHEFIGGYIFLSMRSQDKNQSLNEELFHKLTGGQS